MDENERSTSRLNSRIAGKGKELVRCYCSLLFLFAFRMCYIILRFADLHHKQHFHILRRRTFRGLLRTRNPIFLQILKYGRHIVSLIQIIKTNTQDTVKRS